MKEENIKKNSKHVRRYSNMSEKIKNKLELNLRDDKIKISQKDQSLENSINDNITGGNINNKSFKTAYFISPSKEKFDFKSQKNSTNVFTTRSDKHYNSSKNNKRIEIKNNNYFNQQRKPTDIDKELKLIPINYSHGNLHHSSFYNVTGNNSNSINIPITLMPSQMQIPIYNTGNINYINPPINQVAFDQFTHSSFVHNYMNTANNIELTKLKLYQKNSESENTALKDKLKELTKEIKEKDSEELKIKLNFEKIQENYKLLDQKYKNLKETSEVLKTENKRLKKELEYTKFNIQVK